MSREKNGAFNPGNQTVDLMQKFADRMNRNSKKLVVPFNEGSNKLAKQLSNSHVESMHSNNKNPSRLVPITIAIGVCLGLLLQIRS